MISKTVSRRLKKTHLFLIFFLVIVILNTNIIRSDENINNTIENTEEIQEEIEDIMHEEIIEEETNESIEEETNESIEEETTNGLDDLYIDIKEIGENETLLDNLENVVNSTYIKEENETIINKTEELEKNISENITDEIIPIEVIKPVEKEEFIIFTDKKEYNLGEEVIVLIDAKDYSDINIIISNNEKEYVYTYSDQEFPAKIKFHLTNVVGTYQVKGIIFDGNEPTIFIQNFEVLPGEEEEQKLIISIDSKTEVSGSEMVKFDAIVWGGSEELEYEWYFSDDKSTADTKTTTHSFNEAGAYLISLVVRDDNEVSEDTILIHVIPANYKFIVNVENEKGVSIREADVIFNNEAKKTDMSGSVVFYTTKGEYELSATKNGYFPYKSTEKISNTILKTIRLENSVNLTEKIKDVNDSLIGGVTIKNKAGRKISSITEPNDIVSLSFDLKTSKGAGLKTSSLSDSYDTIISINDFEGLNARWDNIEQVKIKKENNGLTKPIERTGSVVQKIISIENTKSFIDEDSYYGSVQFDVSKTDFNEVYYCPNDVIDSCEELESCFSFDGKACYSENGGVIVVYIPHFSTVMIILDNTTANVSIISPDNSTALETGENVYLNFSVDENVTANYSLGENSLIISPAFNGTDTEFSTILNGSLNHYVLNNGQHTIIINIQDGNSNTAQINYQFLVNDTTAPSITLSPDINNTSLSQSSYSKTINITYDEYTNISYRLNNGNYTESEDVGSDKLINISLTLENGTNNLTINSTDMQGNSRLDFLSFNFTLSTSEGNCSDGILNYHNAENETGIDCGGYCSACVPLNVTADKSVYNTTDNVLVKVIARANSVVNMTVKRAGFVVYSYSFTPVFVGAPISEQRIISNVSVVGNYTINSTMYYLNTTENNISYFEVVSPESSNPLSVTVNANDTTIKKGEKVSFNATVTGNTTPVSYKWDFQNDGTIDSTQPKPIYTYNTNGTYTVELVINDSQWNKTDTETVIVKNLFKIIFVIKDDDTEDYVKRAEVSFDGTKKNTSSNGRLEYIVPEGTHLLTVTKEGYYSHSEDINSNKNKTVEVRLIERDSAGPIINLISPEDGSKIGDTSVELKYKINDKSNTKCTLYSNTGAGFWVAEDISTKLKNNSEVSVELRYLDEITYKWKVECIDDLKNTNISEVRIFIVNSSLKGNSLVDLDQQDNKTKDWISEINNAIEDLDYVKKIDKEAAETLNLKKLMEKAKTTLSRTNRDLHNLKWRRLNGTELEEETDLILEKINEIIEKTPKNIKVVESNEFVKYPEKNDVEDVISIFLDYKSPELDKKEKKSFIENNLDLQSSIIVTTKVKIINMEYLSGEKEEITLIRKIINSDDDITDYVLIESVPKNIAETVNDMEILFDYEVIKDDPVLKITSLESQEYSYYIKEKIEAKEVENTKTIILSEGVNKKKGNLITGFAIFDNLNEKLSNKKDKRLIIEVSILIILVVVYLVYSLGNIKTFENIFMKKEDLKKLDDIKNNIDKAFGYLEKDSYEEAKSAYAEIGSSFTKLPKETRNIFYKKIIELGNEINLVYIKRLIKNAFGALDKKDYEKASLLYSQINPIYKNISLKYKSEINNDCFDLHKKIEEKIAG